MAQEHLRLGPRPLGLHLWLTGLALTSSLSAWSFSKNGSPAWSAPYQEKAAALEKALRKSGAEAASNALAGAALHQHRAFLDGLLAYRHHPYHRDLAAPAVLAQFGAARLLDYAPGSKGVPLFVVPSLVNRFYILDLKEDQSLLRWLAAQGFHPFVMDWGTPGDAERGFGLEDYILGPLSQAFALVAEHSDQPPVVLGYCMGGLLALALALRHQAQIAGFVAMATPWDFHAEDAGSAAAMGGMLAGLEPILQTMGELPVDLLQSFFVGLDPLLALKKFTAFSRLDPNDSRAQAFVALEDWLNDGVGLAAPVARECLGGWYGDNATAKGLWQVGGQVVDPGLLKVPSLALVPDKDRIVPPASALALAKAIPGAELLRPPAGHIGMVASRSAATKVWQPLAKWLRGQTA